MGLAIRLCLNENPHTKRTETNRNVETVSRHVLMFEWESLYQMESGRILQCGARGWAKIWQCQRCHQPCYTLRAKNSERQHVRYSQMSMGDSEVLHCHEQSRLRSSCRRPRLNHNEGTCGCSALRHSSNIRQKDGQGTTGANQKAVWRLGRRRRRKQNAAARKAQTFVMLHTAAIARQHAQ